ncbi:MAG: hypothetical protein GWN79_08490 [Actinobacteria bacterium]|nr:hypothetical protein [Actinomycetota bacterium]NIS31007.1 hypothetical protein [Actinomycetota bacterium]NIT95431.1 hypothetical protein [Actinomycetota bacterium]NIU19118.1 hypothetical protein [Actinomycetota bacterium]NIU66181.1 hypothetical protein [Actinomycetota bacterium]
MSTAPYGRAHPAAVLAVGVALVVTIGFGIVPGPIDELARDAIPVLASAG